MRHAFNSLPSIFPDWLNWGDRRALLLIMAAVSIAAVACRGGGSNPSPEDQGLQIIQPTVSASECVNNIQPEGAPRFEDIDFSRFEAAVEGLRFYEVEAGTGDTPELIDAVSVEYTGWLVDGCMFDTSYPNPAPFTFPLINVIPGWQQAFSRMREGAVQVIEIGPELAYGEFGFLPRIPPNATLIFHVNLISRITIAEAEATLEAEIAVATAEAVSASETAIAGGADPTQVALGPNCVNQTQPEGAPAFADIDVSRFETLVAGLRFYEIEPGTGDNPSLSDSVSVEYTGWLEDGCMFDTSYPTPGPITFPLANVIAGWQQGLSAMKVGGTWVVEISPELGYGERGSPPVIPGGATLIFHVNLIGKG
ncbi:MAG: FKBP-type peptidyl-prolyl cis-trans isomerase [Chloroflexi bacterium]|nr:FKBP-type peptidyl-prolyl cis-trans isomerase [Chloroflexota bacterium]MDA1297582.1 FKBP-type peptidyl-prolyl cis-trans isomerase [Chloroflexota bacterium]